MTNPDDHNHTGPGWQWLDHTEPTAPQPVPKSRRAHTAPHDTAGDGGAEWAWLDSTPDHRTARARETRMPGRVWAGLAAALGVSGVLIGLGVASLAGQDEVAVAAPAITAAPPTSTSSPAACEGLTGTTVTDKAGDNHSLAGVVAGFQHAYYVQRSADAAMRFLGPESGIVAEALAAGIASIPPGTTHCVAITPIADTAAEVHLAEVRPDGSRIDYLQLVNVRPSQPDTVITNIQRRS
ncbi:hypothetical protein [Nocardia cyriacigeorgica]|uniref:DUF8176 domain-containing protein n=1 Tax=Nocardia cyriacigeorgica TaxID=135487 RepID=A0A5R8N9P4_9NOCA|nr:hypothetical protein [Nocardia cyriacigeorgica]TLF72431.1 hypothetical protein FEK34_29195 [Nocardia cyriacigeorgica]